MVLLELLQRVADDTIMESHVHGAAFDAWLDFNPTDRPLHHVSRLHDGLLQCSPRTACRTSSCLCPYGQRALLTDATSQWLQDMFGRVTGSVFPFV